LSFLPLNTLPDQSARGMPRGVAAARPHYFVNISIEIRIA
jgi:hypothetical protein